MSLRVSSFHPLRQTKYRLSFHDDHWRWSCRTSSVSKREANQEEGMKERLRSSLRSSPFVHQANSATQPNKPHWLTRACFLLSADAAVRSLRSVAIKSLFPFVIAIIIIIIIIIIMITIVRHDHVNIPRGGFGFFSPPIPLASNAVQLFSTVPQRMDLTPRDLEMQALDKLILHAVSACSASATCTAARCCSKLALLLPTATLVMTVPRIRPRFLCTHDFLERRAVGSVSLSFTCSNASVEEGGRVLKLPLLQSQAVSGSSQS